MSITSEAKQEVVRLLALNKKIEAVKYLKETFQVSLSEAKDLVEAIEQELEAGRILIDLNAITTPSVENPPLALSYEARQDVERLLQADKKIEAVKFVRKTYKIGLKKALTWVEEVEQTINPSMKRSVRSRSKKMIATFPRVFGGVAILLLIVMIYFYWSNQRIIGQNIHTKGYVVAIESDRDGFAPVVAYTWEGNDYRYIPRSRTVPSAYDVGETVALYIDRKNPAEPLIDSFTDRWLGITIVGAMATIFTFFSLVLAKILGRF